MVAACGEEGRRGEPVRCGGVGGGGVVVSLLILEQCECGRGRRQMLCGERQTAEEDRERVTDIPLTPL